MSPSSFHVRRSDEPGPGHVIDADGPEEAAMLFLERDGGTAEETRVIVTGEEGLSCCYVISLSVHRVEPC
jgi:hypothetical protein